MNNPRDTFVPIERELDIKCNYLDCMAGMGLAGNGHCYLAGDPYIKNCPKFQDEKKIMGEYEDGK